MKRDASGRDMGRDDTAQDIRGDTATAWHRIYGEMIAKSMGYNSQATACYGLAIAHSQALANGKAQAKGKAEAEILKIDSRKWI